MVSIAMKNHIQMWQKHRKNILDLIKNLKDKTENIVFINSRENKQKIKELYPEIYGHNYCLI